MNKKIIRTKDGFRVTHINRRRACRLMCIECQGWESLFVKCNAPCSLKNYYFMQGKQDAKKRNKDIRDFCLECMGGNAHEVTNCKSFYCPLHPYWQTITDKTTLFAFGISDEVILGTGYDKLISRSVYRGNHLT